MDNFIEPRAPSDEAREPALRSPFIVNLFLAVFVLIHVASQFLDPFQADWLLLNLSLIPLRFTADAAGTIFQGDVPAFVSLLSYAFQHADFIHLGFNSLWFFIFGTVVARRVGNARFIALFIITSIAGALAHLACYWGSDMPVVGASGAVSGLMGASFRFIFSAQRPASLPPASRPNEALPLFSGPVLRISIAWIILNIFLGITGLTPAGFGATIAWEAHLGGYLAGLILFPLFDLGRRWKR